MASINSALKHFGMTSRLIEHELDQVERQFVIDLGREHQDSIGKDDSYYPQIEQKFRAEAAGMAPHYETFYSLEKTIRRLLADTLESTPEGASWWTSNRIPQVVRTNAEQARKKEVDSAFTPRSDEYLDYCTFGELGEIIKSNWDVFGSLFKSKLAVERVMASLNTLRGPIAHCSPLAADEIVRLQLAVRDWFRLMEK